MTGLKCKTQPSIVSISCSAFLNDTWSHDLNMKDIISSLLLTSLQIFYLTWTQSASNYSRSDKTRKARCQKRWSHIWHISVISQLLLPPPQPSLGWGDNCPRNRWLQLRPYLIRSICSFRSWASWSRRTDKAETAGWYLRDAIVSPGNHQHRKVRAPAGPRPQPNIGWQVS